MMTDMYIFEQIDAHCEPTGLVSLNIAFEDRPSRVYVGVSEYDTDRESIVQMLRELAMHIEYDVVGDPH